MRGWLSATHKLCKIGHENALNNNALRVRGTSFAFGWRRVFLFFFLGPFEGICTTSAVAGRVCGLLFFAPSCKGTSARMLSWRSALQTKRHSGLVTATRKCYVGFLAGLAVQHHDWVSRVLISENFAQDHVPWWGPSDERVARSLGF